jgi:hypothetical protein
MNAATASRPSNQFGNGGMSKFASAASSATIASTFRSSHALTYASTRLRRFASRSMQALVAIR